MEQINMVISGLATVEIEITDPAYQHLNVIDALNNNEIAISVLDPKEVIETKSFQKIGHTFIKEAELTYSAFN